jgi:hypothetical protein
VISLPDKAQKEKQGVFGIRIRMGEYEVDVNGTREEVLKTFEDISKLIANVNKAFESVKPKTVTTLTVKTAAAKQETKTENYPKIGSTATGDEAVLKVLESDWGKWRPRTMEELKGTLDANGLDYSSRVLGGVLMGLVKRGTVRRWNTDAGFVYILAEKEALNVKGESE